MHPSRLSALAHRLLASLLLPCLMLGLAGLSSPAQAAKQTKHATAKAKGKSAAGKGSSRKGGKSAPKSLPKIHPVGPKLPAPPAPVGADCAIQWQITPVLDAQPPRLEVALSFDPNGRHQTQLSLPGGWAGVDEGPTATPARLVPVPDAPGLRAVAHGPTDRVHLHWSLTPSASSPQASAVQLNPRWFAAAGHSVLPVPQELDEANPPQACIRLAAPEGNPITPMRWASSHGVAEGSNTVLRPAAGLATLRSRVQQALYAGGALSVATLQAEGQSVNVVTPDGVAWPFSLDSLAQQSAKAVGVQRRFWGDTIATRAPLLVLMLPGVPGQTQAQGSAWYQAVALQSPLDLAVPSATFDALITQALVRTWVPDRIGPVQLMGKDDAALRAWFSEGFADYLAHRSLLREGSWSADDYAAAVGRKLDTLAQSPFRQTDNATLARRWPNDADQADLPAARGELLALRWHNSLRAAGHAGLDAVLRRLLVPAAQARHDGPLSAPLATHRLVAGLRQEMGDTPLRDITRHLEQGEAFGPDATNLGPCLESVPNPVAGQARHRAVAHANTQAACQGWLGLGPLANGSGARLASQVADDASPAGKTGSHAKGKKAGKNAVKAKGKPATKASSKSGGKASTGTRSKKVH